MTTNTPVPGIILSIDGGAMMGVVAARLLSYIDGSAATQTINGQQLTPVDVPTTLPTGVTIPNVFGTIAGTSTGGLLAMALSVDTLATGKPMSANGALEFYLNNATNIFPNSVQTGNVLTVEQMLTETYTSFGNSGLAAAISEQYGAPGWAECYVRTATKEKYTPPIVTWAAGSVANSFTPNFATLDSLTTPDNPTLLITSYNNNLSAPARSSPQIGIQPNIDDTTVPQGPIIISNGTTVTNGQVATPQSISVLQAALMTSAFPMLLPPAPYDLQFGSTPDDNANYFLDGGIYAGSPATVAYLYAAQQSIDVLAFISIGCGSSAVPAGLNYNTVQTMGGNVLSGPGWLNFGGGIALTSVTGHGAAAVTDDLLTNQMGPAYFRLEPTLIGPSGPPWSTDPAVLAGWVQSADALVSAMVTAKTWGPMMDQILNNMG